MARPNIVVAGAGPAGLAVALGLARRGLPVTVVERDAQAPPEDPRDAFEGWARPGVAHSRLPHSLLARSRRTLRRHAPDVLESMLAAGAWENDLFSRLVKEARSDGDRELVVIHCRRPVFESVLRRAVSAEPLVRLLPGVAAVGVELQRSPRTPPRVTGLCVDGEVIPADVVVDAAGRRSPIARRLSDHGVALAEPETTPCNLVYYCRYYRLLPGADYPAWTGVLGPAGTTDCARFSTFFGDNRTFAVVLGVASWEGAFRRLADAAVFTAALQLFRTVAPFLAADVSEPITDMLPMGSLQNVFRPPLLDGAPPVLGLHFLGDAYCHTNPLFAWGLCLGLDHGFELARIIEEHAGDVEAQARAYASATAVEAEQCYRAVAEEDTDRSLAWRQERPSGSFLGRSFAAFLRECAGPFVVRDPEIAGPFLRRANLLDLPDALRSDAAFVERVVARQDEITAPPPGMVPSRDELLDVMGVRQPS